LPQKQHPTQEKPPQDFLVLNNGFEWLPETEANFEALFLDCIVNSHDFFLHVDVGAVELADPAEIFDAFLTSAPGKEPSRRFFEGKRAKE
jgi:hypothetical protein